MGMTVVMMTLFMGGISLLSSCHSEPDVQKIRYRMGVYENMVPPIIVIAQSDRTVILNNKGEVDSGMKGSIMLQDSKGTTVSFLDDEFYGATLVPSYVKGDTLLSIIK